MTNASSVTILNKGDDMNQETKTYLIDKAIQNILMSALVFMIWSHFVPWRLYFGFGLIVAGVLAIKQIKEFKPLWYIPVAIGDVVLWPAMLVIDIRQKI